MAVVTMRQLLESGLRTSGDGHVDHADLLQHKARHGPHGLLVVHHKRGNALGFWHIVLTLRRCSSKLFDPKR